MDKKTLTYRYLPILIGVFTVLLISGGLFGYLYWQSKQIISTPMPSPNVKIPQEIKPEEKKPPEPTKEIQPTPTSEEPTPTPNETNSWDIYQNKNYGFEIKHPSDWTETPNISSVNIMGMDISTFSLILASPLEGETDAFQEYVSVAVADLPITLTLDQYFGAATNQAKASLKNSKIIESTEITISGLSAKRIVMTGELNQLSLKELVIFIMKDKKAYGIIYAAEANKYSNYLEMANKIIETFKFF